MLVLGTKFPILEQFEWAADDGRRAELMLAAPPVMLMRYREAFEKACDRAGWSAGRLYLERVHVFLTATRKVDGWWDEKHLVSLAIANEALQAFVAPSGPEPDHSITEL